MLKEISGPYYIVCGYTDLRRGIDGLAGIVRQNFNLKRQEDSDFYKSEMNCRQPVRAAKILTIQKSDDKM